MLHCVTKLYERDTQSSLQSLSKLTRDIQKNYFHSCTTIPFAKISHQTVVFPAWSNPEFSGVVSSSSSYMALKNEWPHIAFAYRSCTFHYTNAALEPAFAGVRLMLLKSAVLLLKSAVLLLKSAVIQLP